MPTKQMLGLAGLLLALTSCTQAGYQAAANRVNVGECPFTAEFAGRPTITSKRIDVRLDKAELNQGGLNQVLLCVCTDNLIAENANQSDAMNFMRVALNDDDIKTVKSDFNPAGRYGKELNFEGHRDQTMSGPGSVYTKLIFVQHCIVGAAAGNSDQLGKQPAERFLSSLTRIGEPPSAAKPSATVEDRLRTLKDLFDKGLVTPAEYETRRKEILSAL